MRMDECCRRYVRYYEQKVGQSDQTRTRGQMKVSVQKECEYRVAGQSLFRNGNPETRGGLCVEIVRETGQTDRQMFLDRISRGDKVV